MAAAPFGSSLILPISYAYISMMGRCVTYVLFLLYFFSAGNNRQCCGYCVDLLCVLMCSPTR